MNNEPRRFRAWVAWFVTLALCALHGLTIWVGMGGRQGLSSPWPLASQDHPHYFHAAVIGRDLLAASGTTAGYDSSFMAGYPKSIFAVNSSTLPELAVLLIGKNRSVWAYKLYVLLSAILPPWLVACAGVAWRVEAEAITVAVLGFLLYIWTDFPISYVEFGMLPYFLAIPLGLLTTAAITNYLDRGGLRWWFGSALGSIVVVLVHLTSALVVVPAAALAYIVAFAESRRSGRRWSLSRHLGVWFLPPIVLAANAFWWLPGVWLWATKGASDFVFVHTEGVLVRLWQIVSFEPPMQAVLLGAGLVGAVTLASRDRIAAAGLGGFAAAGFCWGYLAGGFRWLDFLQPGRHTYALFTAAAMAGGVGIAEVRVRLRTASGAGVRFDRWVTLAMLVILIRISEPALARSIPHRLGGPMPMLSSRPSDRLLWVFDRVKRHVRAGERLLYEEGGSNLPGVPDPFDGGRYSGLLPHFVERLEVLGGPYLHTHLTTNFTQFGEGKLFENPEWGRDHFERYARLYRPSAIVCWSLRARTFCRRNPDLINIIDDDGTVLIGRIHGFEGAAIVGSAEVVTEPGKLQVRSAKPGPDGWVVLRYHFVPYLRSHPPVPLKPVWLEDDPVPFIGLRPTEGPVTLKIDFPF